jgi:hypothetical protein
VPDDQLLEREHVSYELPMLCQTAARLEHDPEVHDDWVVRNALRNRDVHARRALDLIDVALPLTGDRGADLDELAGAVERLRGVVGGPLGDLDFGGHLSALPDHRREPDRHRAYCAGTRGTL